MAIAIDNRCSRHFTYADLIQCGHTWHKLASDPATRIANVPTQAATWGAMEQLAQQILDPLMDHFGSIELTYGFAGPALTRHIKSRIAPRLDQHAGSELNRAGRLICPRRGLACDLRIQGHGAEAVASFIVEHLPFDRIYLYGSDRPLHISIGPENTQQVTEMRPNATGRLVPRSYRPGEWPQSN